VSVEVSVHKMTDHMESARIIQWLVKKKKCGVIIELIEWRS
jgi:hypothetical protein